MLEEPDLTAQLAVLAREPGQLRGIVGAQTEALLSMHQDREQQTVAVADALPGGGTSRCSTIQSSMSMGWSG